MRKFANWEDFEALDANVVYSNLVKDKNSVPMVIGDKIRGTATWLGVPIRGVVDFRNGAYGIRWMRGEVETFNPFCTFCRTEWEVLE